MRRRRLRDLSIVQSTPNSEDVNSEQQTVVGSSNVPETLDEPEEFQSNVKVRGCTLLRDLYDLDLVERVKEVKSRQKIRRLQLFEITHRKKDGCPMTSEAGEIMEKLKEKKAEYEAIASTDSSVNLENIDNRIITEVLGPERDQIAQMQVNTVELIAEVQRKYEELQQHLRAEATEREAATAAREAAAAAREAEARAREAEVAAMAEEQSKKYDDLQLQFQQMMQMFQQS
ncbi:hypothetical protein GOBAR_AA07336 [Gossypium barbadense]|uniref:Uncharacterized protein n=1 Tax=Gossypium barbadense TaxID=3634 RepID=A0A2P5YCK2_GOSBA|nr:hypothetical protein GOBAR_AA07336 [Gossypium barbadense]